MLPDLTHKQRRFVEEYAVDFNGTQAWIRAGYATKGAKQNAHVLMKRPEVAAAIEAEMSAKRERAHMKADEVMAELAKLARANMGTYLPAIASGDLSALTPEDTAAISEVVVEQFMDNSGEEAKAVRRTRIKLHDKRAALVDIGKHLGLFPSRTELTGPGGGPVEIEAVPSKDKMAMALLHLFRTDGVPDSTLAAPHRQIDGVVDAETRIPD